MDIRACPDEESLAAYLNGTLREDDRVEVEKHLKHCPDCTSTIQHAKDTPAGAEVAEPPSHLLSRLKKEVD
jgi:anti-sigma factor RsiW